MMRGRRRWALLLVAVALLSTSCSKKKYDSTKVIDIVDATTPHSYRLSYDLTEGGTKIAVKGIVEDDFRYKLQLSRDDQPAAEQVVVDDAVALRFFDHDLVEGYLDPTVEGKVDTKTNIAGASVVDALDAGRWVLDAAGAPSPILQTAADTKKGVEAPKDPLFDARTALGYVRRVAETSYFREYDPESINPTYRKDEDPFPVPSRGSGVTRFDAVIYPMPAASEATSGSRTLPVTQNFRKMAVYVKHGKVIAVRELIGASPRQLRQLQDYEEALLKATADDGIVAGFRQRTRQLAGDPDALSEFLLGGLNTFIASTGDPPIHFRTMSLEISDLDAVSTRVDLPTDAIEGNLAVIRNLGRKPVTTGDAATGA